MTLIIGLGNPGRKYSQTRHNVGFMVIDNLAKRYGVSFVEKKEYLIGIGHVDGRRIALVKPQTYMNLSGVAVKKLVDKTILENLPQSIIVIHDDLDLPVGKMKIKRNGSSGGHKGIQSIIENLGTKDFIRVKIGIGKDPGIDVSDYVLKPFSKEQKPLVKEKILQAADSVVTILNEGVDKAMSIYNREDA
ncbi:aminoacyl-tRNA hydrolase [Thermodesulfovibrio sp.]|uniref:aminoacyl-tRNA hydrolase n=1 Tax=Thermodesulfovibrio sp. TaxID=2067987 RepID=UPI0030A10FB4